MTGIYHPCLVYGPPDGSGTYRLRLPACAIHAVINNRITGTLALPTIKRRTVRRTGTLSTFTERVAAGRNPCGLLNMNEQPLTQSA